ncbi:unnamed protein product, partial [marine sediment metagenome]
ERILPRGTEPPAPNEGSSTYGAPITLSRLGLHFQFIVAEIPEPSNCVIVQVDPGVAELIKYGAPDRFSDP